jgi:LmbE family N-acetylglucosaminyl deacetylase
MSHILVISPHPDDEAIGCGGTLRGHVVQGDVVGVVFLTSGENGGQGRTEEETARIRESEAAEAAGIIGIAKLDFWRESDGTLRATRELVDRLRLAVDEWKPEVIYVTHAREMHPDHRAAARLVRRTVLADYSPSVQPVVRMFEVWTPLQQMDEIVDITPYLETKMTAIRAYKSQCDLVRFDEAALGLSRYRGELHSWPGGEYAEIFHEMRI